MDATITSKGQTTIPSKIREHLGLKPGDKVSFLLRHDGQVVMLARRPAAELRRPSRYKGPPLSIEQMDDAIGATRVRRTKP
jgi:AbrB family looped-hinge helix DNA binding protein